MEHVLNNPSLTIAIALARPLAKVFKENNQDVVCIDSNPDACTASAKD